MTNSHSQTDRQNSTAPVVLVTGAGSGVGRSTCRLLAERGWRIALVGRSQAKLDETIQDMARSRESFVAIAADISKPEEAADAVDQTVARFGPLDALVNNAGSVELVRVEHATQAALDRIFAANAFGPFNLVARAWSSFVSQGSGCVVNVSSLSAHDPFPGLAIYGAAKSALEGLTRGIVNEGRHLGIRAFTVAPGAIETPMLRSIVSEKDLPSSATLDPLDVARLIVECIEGKRDADIGRVIRIER